MKSLTQQDDKMTEQDASAGHIGFFTVVAVVLLLLCWGWWKTFTMEPPQRFSVLFADIAGLHVNAPVNVNGMLIGSVETLHLEGRRKVRVGIKINVERVRIPVGSKFTILSNGAIGSKYIEVLLPEDVPGEPPSPLIAADSVVEGEKTIRVEVVVNKIAGALENVDLKSVDARLSRSLDSLDRAANSVSYLVDSTKPLTAKTMALEDNMNALTRDIRVTNRNINRLISDPHFTNNLKEVAQNLRETSERIQATVNQASSTLSDKPLRQDILTALDKLKASTQSIEQAAVACKSIGENVALRTDVMQILQSAKEDMNLLDKEVNSAHRSGNVNGTLDQLRQAVTHMNVASQQMNQILDKRAPLLHLLFGRPGHIRVAHDTTLDEIRK